MSTHDGPSSPTPAPSTVDLPPRIVVQLAENRWRRFSRWLSWMAWGLLLLIVIQQTVSTQDYYDTTHNVRERFVTGQQHGRDKIAIIRIEGMILSGEGYVKNQIDRVREDDRVKAVVVRVDSPGGTVTGSDYIYHHLRKLREEKNLPMVVSMGSMAASGGYYVAMAVGDTPDSIFAEPTTTTGSIGVMIPHYDISGLLERFDIKDDSIASHPRKFILSMTRPMPEDQRQLVQQQIDEMFARFKQIVLSGRPGLRGNDDRIESGGRDLATGEIFSAEQAVQYGLVDKIGFLEEALDRAAELANLDRSRARVVEYKRTGTLLDSLAGQWSSARRVSAYEWSWAEQLLEAGVPRPYFLLTSFPPLASSSRAVP